MREVTLYLLPMGLILAVLDIHLGVCVCVLYVHVCVCVLCMYAWVCVYMLYGCRRGTSIYVFCISVQ